MGGSGGIALLILKLDTRWRLMVSVMARLLHPPPHRGKEPKVPLEYEARRALESF